ncbi:hypothetical protein H257_06935 [Aphanomyces astaci]|uniref:Uncharacterized protein n=1 Tax=Aphanomyces astaci TaxID=112090 RepID=W4GJ12_APHAT|nr:hypothetical protein H257_06935 [Aphanomyces astaci]ETV79685.1 hypothetical protein H257_06935 [Aphanomyces astaci]|eukprot:XP_009830621.1 hypothetical protein H257_06935 [Aphanomyces astaci]
MLTHGCALGQALADVLAEMEAEGESLTLGEKEATMQVMEDILFSHMQDASDFSETAPSRRGTNTSGSRRRVATDVGLHVVANVEEYSSYMETWRMHMTDTTIKVEGDVLNPTCPDMDATFRRMERRRKKQTKRKHNDEEYVV